MDPKSCGACGKAWQVARVFFAVMERKDCWDLPGFSFLRCFNYSMSIIYTICVLAIVYSIYIYEKFKAAKKGLADWPVSFDAKVQKSLVG